MELLFKNITAVTMRKDECVLKNANVGVLNGKIILNANPDGQADRIIDGTNKVLIPGLYNCHTHAPMSLFRGIGNDLPLEDWLFNHIFPAEKKLTPSIVRAGALLAIAEMIASGTVSFTDMYYFMDEIAEAADEAGVMANLSNGVINMGRDDFDFYKCGEYLQTQKTIETYHRADHNRIRADASIHAVYTSDEKAWRPVVEYAAENNLRMHLHLSETKTEHDGCVEKYGATPAEIFEKHNVFGVPVTAAHCVWVTENDIEILARNGASAVHNPVSNLKLASGTAPVKAMLDKGLNVALGTDGMASNNSHDLFEEIKLASIAQKNALNDPTALPAIEVLKMATVGGAKSQGREAESGTIDDGYDADLVLLDFANPRQTPCYDPVLNLAYSTTGRDVQMTLCKGKILYEDGEHKTIDVEKILSECNEIKNIFG